MENLRSREWFTEHIGMRIFRDNECTCPTCLDISRNGIIITDETQAEYMYQTQMDFAQEEHYLNYRSSKNENRTNNANYQ